MDDPEGALNFDFEGGLETAPLNPSGVAPLIPPDPAGPIPAGPTPVNNSDPGVAGNLPGRRSFRQTVCRHWLRSLCMKGDACGFLHQFDKSRMPVCRFFRIYGECREKDCVYKHTNEDIKECNMYKLGFCPNGPDCRYRHAKLPGPPPPVEEVFQKLQQLSYYNFGAPNRFFQHRNTGYNQQAEKIQFPQANQVPMAKLSTAADSPSVQQEQQQTQHIQQPEGSQNQGQNLTNGLMNPSNRASTAPPLPQGQSRYFIVKSCNRENLELSVQKGVWATQRSNEAKLNEAFDSSENVILIFSVNRTRHFQGCAKMTSKTGGFVGAGGWKYAHGTAHYGRNFSLKWLKLCELSFHKTRHLRNPYNENLPVKISRDCQELEPSIGEQLVSLLYLEPDSELMAISVTAESKREEEKAKGVTPAEGAENPDIVPFEDNEEEEEDESDEEEENSSQTLGMIQGRGRGRGAMWSPHMPYARGGRPLAGVKPMGFLPGMMGPDAFSYGAIPTDGFTAMPDVFGRTFTPYGLRFPGDFSGLGQNPGMGFMEGTGPTSGMVFRPPQPGGVFPGGGLGGMMMGSGRGPFLGGLGMQARANRPMGLPPFRPPQAMSGAGRAGKRDQRRPMNDRNSGGDMYPSGPDQVKAQEMTGPAGGPDADPKYPAGPKVQPQDAFGAGSSFGNDESESEDEAPRRSRHGEGKKKRRGSEGDAGGDHWE